MSSSFSPLATAEQYLAQINEAVNGFFKRGEFAGNGTIQSYDHMKTAVDKVQKGKERIVNTRFASMTAYYLFDPDFCNVASGWEKGIVEKNVQDSRRRIWLDASTMLCQLCRTE